MVVVLDEPREYARAYCLNPVIRTGAGDIASCVDREETKPCALCLLVVEIETARAALREATEQFDRAAFIAEGRLNVLKKILEACPDPETPVEVIMLELVAGGLEIEALQ